MKSIVLPIFVAAALLAGVTAYAHHSFGAVYDGKKEVKLEGKMAGFTMRSPHSFVQLDVTDAKGKTERWALEWNAGATLSSQNISANTFKVGDKLIITGHPSRVPDETRAQLITLRRPADGFNWGLRPGETNVD
jgi:hypothetical protein